MSDDANSSDAPREPSSEGPAATPPAVGERSSSGEPTSPAPEPPAVRPSYGFLAGVSAVCLAADLGTKAWAVKALAEGRRIEVVQNFWRFDLAHNRGGAWGVLGNQPDSVRLPFFFLVSAVAVAFIVSLYKKLEPGQTALKWSLPLVLGGALGNIVDRIRYTHVIDFIDMFYVDAENRQHHWPTYNVADICIVVGVGLMAIDMFAPRKPIPEGDTAPSAKGEGA
jgi:signal peptidase II